MSCCRFHGRQAKVVLLGTWYSKPLKLLNVGDRIWVKAPGFGFVGVGRIKGPRASASKLGTDRRWRCSQRVTTIVSLWITPRKPNTSALSSGCRLSPCSKPSSFRHVSSWPGPSGQVRAERVGSARVVQTSTCSAMARASSTSMPKYLTVLSIFVCPSKS